MLRSGARSIRRVVREAQTCCAGAHAQGFAAQAAPADDMMEVFVDGKPVQIPKGSTTLQACDAAGVDIPR